jgi:hypothetical protein
VDWEIILLAFGPPIFWTSLIYGLIWVEGRIRAVLGRRHEARRQAITARTEDFARGLVARSFIVRTDLRVRTVYLRVVDSPEVEIKRRLRDHLLAGGWDLAVRVTLWPPAPASILAITFVVASAALGLLIFGQTTYGLHLDFQHRRRFDAVVVGDRASKLQAVFAREPECLFRVDEYEVRYYVNTGMERSLIRFGLPERPHRAGCAWARGEPIAFKDLPRGPYCAAVYVVSAAGRIEAMELLGESGLERDSTSPLPSPWETL